LLEAVGEWVAEHREDFVGAEVGIDATVVTRALAEVDRRHGLVNGALARLAEGQAELARVVAALMGRV
jgi:hypothetical protein